MFDERTNLAHQVRDDLRDFFGDQVFSTVIPRNIRLAGAEFGQTIFLYDPGCKGAARYLELAKEVISHDEKGVGRSINALLQKLRPPRPGWRRCASTASIPTPFNPATNSLKTRCRARGFHPGQRHRPAYSRSPQRLGRGTYQLVVGEHRWRAARLAGLETMPAIIRKLTDQDALELALTENLLRRDLNPIEVAHAYQTLQDEYHLSHEQIADASASTGPRSRTSCVSCGCPRCPGDDHPKGNHLRARPGAAGPGFRSRSTPACCRGGHNKASRCAK